MGKIWIGEEAEWLYNFSMNLKFKLRESPITYKKLSTISGVPAIKISEYVRGMSKPDDESIAKLAKALNCEVKDLTDRPYDMDDFWSNREEDNNR